jgi:hypothetical protein
MKAACIEVSRPTFITVTEIQSFRESLSLPPQPSTTSFHNYILILSTYQYLFSNHQNNNYIVSHNMFDDHFRSEQDTLMFTFPHPWSMLMIRGQSDSHLIAVYNEISEAFRMGTLALYSSGERRRIRETRERIKSVLLGRGTPGYVPDSAPTVGLPFDFTTPQLPAGGPQVIITMNTPQRPTREPLPERPAQLHIYDDYGRLVEIRDETENEKKDREYEIWRQRQR